MSGPHITVEFSVNRAGERVIGASAVCASQEDVDLAVEAMQLLSGLLPEGRPKPLAPDEPPDEAGEIVEDADWDDSHGSAPDATGDLSSEAFVRESRDAWPDRQSSEPDLTIPDCLRRAPLKQAVSP